jgi:hypothetical protein
MMGVASQHHINNCYILVGYKDYDDVYSKDTATLAPHLSKHSKANREEERFWLKEHRQPEMKQWGNPAVRNHTHCVDLRKLKMSE